MSGQACLGVNDITKQEVLNSYLKGGEGWLFQAEGTT